MPNAPDNVQIREILATAAELPVEQRRAFLDNACGDNDAIRAEVESLLAALDDTRGVMDEPTTTGRPSDSDSERQGMPIESGTQVGAYKLLKRLGEGGMGVVYLAEQQHPVRRRVAIKIIKPGMDSAAIIARFEAERQALAMMDHPNIARVFEAGSTSRGLPYFAMELVEGSPITRYCDEKQLTPHDRLLLFVSVCRAVQHAHQKGIIHRDLKPGNVLVAMIDGKPVPKVIDFGVAKALHQNLTDKTLSTQLGSIVGTLEYMSPEQAMIGVEGVDTRSDIYSLGVLLYELLTGTTPIGREALRQAGYEQIVRVIRDVDPPIPSTRVGASGDAMAAVSARRGVDPRRLARLIRGDLDWIAMKCLEKDRARRYETADALALDVGRYLDHEPVFASPPSAVYRVRKFARRNRAAVSMLGAITILLGGFVVTVFLVRATVDRRQKATTAAGLVKRLNDAEIDQVPSVVADIEGYRQWADPLLRQEYSSSGAESREKLHSGLALLPGDPVLADFLCGRLLTAKPAELPVIRDALFPYRQTLVDRLWSEAERPDNGNESIRLRAAAALAKYDPVGPNWKAVSQIVATDLIEESPLYLGQWSDAFRPVKDILLPTLIVAFRDSRVDRLAERNLATHLLVDYAVDEPRTLCDVLMDADEKQFAVIYPKCGERPDQSLPILVGAIDTSLPGGATEQARETLARRQANAAVALLRLNQPARVWPLLKHTPDPRVRSYLIHRLGPLGADSAAIINRLDQEPEISIRRALILSLGEFSDRQFRPEQRQLLTARLQELYRDEPDPGLHAAVEWLLRTWKRDVWLAEVNERWAKDDEGRSRKVSSFAGVPVEPRQGLLPQWYVNSQCQTMVVVPGPVEFLMGSPMTEAGRESVEVQHHVRISRHFALAAKSVTVEQYHRFVSDYDLPEVNRRTANLPVVGTSWFEAAAYCNWLSRQDEIPENQWCYELDNGKVAKLRDKYLSLAGYRLPTEAEMEYTTRARSDTRRYYGESDELLEKYAWYFDNADSKTQPVGTKKPNDLGFFDLHGNVWCWCQERYALYPTDEGSPDDTERDLEIDSSAPRVLRGGSFTIHASDMRSAFRVSHLPAVRFVLYGFRPARTIAPGPAT